MKFLKLAVASVATLFAGASFAALDTTATVTAITGSVTNVETVAVAIIGAAAVLFGISKIRQVIKA